MKRLIMAQIFKIMMQFQVIGLTVIGLSLWLRLDPTFEEMMRKNLLRINNNNTEMDEVKGKIRLGVSLAF